MEFRRSYSTNDSRLREQANEETPNAGGKTGVGCKLAFSHRVITPQRLAHPSSGSLFFVCRHPVRKRAASCNGRCKQVTDGGTSEERSQNGTRERQRCTRGPNSPTFIRQLPNGSIPPHGNKLPPRHRRDSAILLTACQDTREREQQYGWPSIVTRAFCWRVWGQRACYACL